MDACQGFICTYRKEAGYGIPFRFRDHPANNDYDPSLTGKQYVDLYLYKGIVEKGRTKRLKDEVVQAFTYQVEHFYSKEISITTPIKIEKVGKVRVYYNAGSDYYDPNRFIKVERI